MDFDQRLASVEEAVARQRAQIERRQGEIAATQAALRVLLRAMVRLLDERSREDFIAALEREFSEKAGRIIGDLDSDAQIEGFYRSEELLRKALRNWLQDQGPDIPR